MISQRKIFACIVALLMYAMFVPLGSVFAENFDSSESMELLGQVHVQEALELESTSPLERALIIAVANHEELSYEQKQNYLEGLTSQMSMQAKTELLAAYARQAGCPEFECNYNNEVVTRADQCKKCVQGLNYCHSCATTECEACCDEFTGNPDLRQLCIDGCVDARAQAAGATTPVEDCSCPVE